MRGARSLLETAVWILGHERFRAPQQTKRQEAGRQQRLRQDLDRSEGGGVTL